MNQDQQLEVLKMLFVEHHRQLSEKRQKIHSTTEKTLGAFIVITGWLIANDIKLVLELLLIIIAFIVILAFVANKTIHTNNKSYYKILRVIHRINKSFRLYEKELYLNKRPIYPDDMRKSSKAPQYKGWLYHLLVITSGALLSIATAIVKFL